MAFHRGVLLPLCLSFGLTVLAQDTALRPKDVREMGKGGADAIPKLAALLTNPAVEIRLEAVKQISEIGTQYGLDPLIQATHDADAEIQIRATDGLVNFYLPGYLKTGLASSVRRVGVSIKGRFTDTNDQAIDPYVMPRADVIAALGALARNGASSDARANAARAIGILRGKAALPDLVEAMHSKDTAVIYESLVALQKIRDRDGLSAGRLCARADGVRFAIQQRLAGGEPVLPLRYLRYGCGDDRASAGARRAGQRRAPRRVVQSAAPGPQRSHALVRYGRSAAAGGA